MSRLLLEILPLLLLPLVLYLAWWQLTRGRALAQGRPPPDLSKGPWAWLLAGGLGLAIAGLAYISLTSGEEPGGTYVPPSFEDGRIVPSHIDR